ncbi:MAG TPA: methyltransferase domain-containing protein [Tepidiformaceae bacterium]|nr:methyltransferase domain-containing protein [Tepidiformaceae bacterium]
MTDAPLGINPTTLLAEWAKRVRANRDQAEAFREGAESLDFYARVVARFKADPRRSGEANLDYLRSLVRPGERWLDIGAGAGRYALPLALAGARVTAIDPSPGMLSALSETAEEHGVSGVSVLEGRWPMDGGPPADVAFIAHVGYDIEEIGPFLDAMEASASRLCVAELLSESPATAFARLWPGVHGVERNLLPALPEFLALLLARGRLPSVWLSERPAGTFPDAETVARFARLQLFIQEGSEKDQKLRDEVLPAVLQPQADGSVMLQTHPVRLGVVTWDPRG